MFLRGPQAREKVAEPTLRQREVIQLIAEGRSMKEAANILKITRRTVAAHKYAVMELLQLKTNADLVQYAVKHISSLFSSAVRSSKAACAGRRNLIVGI